MTRDTALRNRDQVTLAATAAGLLLSVHISLFGYQESMAVPYAELSLGVEFGGAAVLVLAGTILLFVRPRLRTKPLRAGTRTKRYARDGICS